MNPDLEALFKLYDAWMEAKGSHQERQRREVYYDSLKQIGEKHPHVAASSLDGAVARRYPRWRAKNPPPDA